MGSEANAESAAWWRCTAVVRADAFEHSKNRPLIVQAVSPEGERAEWVLKPFAQLSAIGSVRELLAHRLAALLGVPTPPFAILDVPDRLLRATSGLARDRLNGSVGPNFGSRFQAGFAEVSTPEAIRVAQRPTATDIYGFDIVVDNVDRRPEKPNMIAGDGRLLAIDHEHTLLWMDAIPRTGPIWHMGILHGLMQRHLLRGYVHRWGHGCAALKDRILQLDDTGLHELVAGIPSSWLTGAVPELVAELPEYLRDVQRKADTVFSGLEGGRND